MRNLLNFLTKKIHLLFKIIFYLSILFFVIINIYYNVNIFLLKNSNQDYTVLLKEKTKTLNDLNTKNFNGVTLNTKDMVFTNHLLETLKKLDIEIKIISLIGKKLTIYDKNYYNISLKFEKLNKRNLTKLVMLSIVLKQDIKILSLTTTEFNFLYQK